jgi:hypothetical protein
MKKTCFLLLSAELFLGGYAFAATPEIKLSGRKDRVLSSQMREVVLDVAVECLNQGDSDFVALAGEIENPYSFKQEEVVTPERPTAVVSKEPEATVVAPVVYDDTSVLNAIGSRFAKQVRGTLARGSIHYLQLQGGGMLKSGTSFPAKIPQVEGKSFTVTIVDVNSRGYTLKMGDASLTLPFDVSSAGSSGASKDSAN